MQHDRAGHGTQRLGHPLRALDSDSQARRDEPARRAIVAADVKRRSGGLGPLLLQLGQVLAQRLGLGRAAVEQRRA